MVDGGYRNRLLCRSIDLTPEVIKSSIDFLKTLQTNRSQEASDFVRSDARRAVREAGSTFEME
jgi:hypothetical protein